MKLVEELKYILAAKNILKCLYTLFIVRSQYFYYHTRIKYSPHIIPHIHILYNYNKIRTENGACNNRKQNPTDLKYILVSQEKF